MDPATLQQVRSTPLFAGLPTTQLGCIEPGEIIEAPAGTVLAAEGERTGFFHVVLEGEVRITRTYDRQAILMGVTKAGQLSRAKPCCCWIFPGSPTVRVSKAGAIISAERRGFLANAE